MVSASRKKLYRMRQKRSLCKGKRTSNPNRCKKVKNCKVARGNKRTFCRKKAKYSFYKKEVNLFYKKYRINGNKMIWLFFSFFGFF